MEYRVLAPVTGLIMREFKGEASILEVECSGNMLSTGVDVFQIVLYTVAENTLTAYVNPLKHECLTSSSFSSCQIDPKDSRNTKLRTLVTDLKAKETRAYGCNITSSKAGGRVGETSWVVNVGVMRK